jgi:hypothetical protein
MNQQHEQLEWDQIILEMLRACAHQLLLAQDETGRMDLALAFEHTIQACQVLAFGGTHCIQQNSHYTKE